LSHEEKRYSYFEFIPTAPAAAKKQETIEILEPRKQYNIGMIHWLID
jgi:hypothetical protein